jgi:hypothetical protein
MKKFIFIFILAEIILANEWIYDCMMNLSIPVQPNTVITNQKLINCTEASIFWNYPMNNLTSVFSSKENKPFQFCLINSNQIYNDIPVYRVEENQETRVVKSDDNVCMQSDSLTNTVTLRFVGPKQMKYYGVFIQYSIQ